MDSASNDIVRLLDAMKSSVLEFERSPSEHILRELDVNFRHFAQLVTLFLVSERDVYYGYFFMSMTFRTNFNKNVIAGIRLDEYPPVFETNPLILLKYSLKEILYIFCHEVDHVVFNHPAEMVKSNPNKDPDLFRLFNYAADASVNDALNEEIRKGKKFMAAPQGAVTSNALQNMFGLSNVAPRESYLYYFDLIKDLGDEIESADNNGIAPIPGETSRPANAATTAGAQGSPQPVREHGEGAGTVTARDATGNIQDHVWSSDATQEDTPPGGFDEMIAETIKELLNEVNDMMGAEARGMMPARFTSAIERANRPPTLNWQAILKKYVGTVATEKTKTRMRLNRRQPRRYDLSGSRESKTLKIVVAIDTSGSVSDEEVRQIFDEIFGIIARRKFELTVIECDMEIQRVYQVRTVTDLPDHVTGRGGTAFSPVIRYINEHKYFRDALLIYFTDGFGEYVIPRPRTYRNLWVVFGDEKNLSVNEPYGMALPLKEHP